MSLLYLLSVAPYPRPNHVPRPRAVLQHGFCVNSEGFQQSLGYWYSRSFIAELCSRQDDGSLPGRLKAYQQPRRIPPVLRSTLARLIARFQGEVTDTEREDETGDATSVTNESADDAGFCPSRLDASVLFAHGKRVDYEGDAPDELEAKARELERERRER